MGFVWVDEHIYTTLMHFMYIIIILCATYGMVCFLSYSDDCSVIH